LTCDRHIPKSGRTAGVNGRGFTLVELLLTVALVLLLASAAVFNLSSLQRGARLDEGSTQLEALLRFARAQAESSGRVIELVSDEEDGTNAVTTASTEVPQLFLRLRWEVDPLGSPGIFQELPETPRYLESIQALLRIEGVNLKNESASSAPATRGGTTSVPTSDPTGAKPRRDATTAARGSSRSIASASFTGDDSSSTATGFQRPAIRFYPDGSSDSVEFIISSQDEEDVRRYSIQLSGITGSIRRSRAPRDGEILAELGDEGDTESNPPVQTTSP